MAKPLILALVLVLCLAVVGVGYAAVWGNDVYVEGTVTTGNAVIEWAATTCSDNDQDPGYGDVECAITSGNTGFQNDVLTITITNAYPGYEAYINTGLHNTGTVPATVGPIIPTAVPAGIEVVLDGNAFVDGTVLYPCEPQAGTIVVKVDPDTSAIVTTPNTTYDFSITVDPGIFTP